MKNVIKYNGCFIQVDSNLQLKPITVFTIYLNYLMILPIFQIIIFIIGVIIIYGSHISKSFHSSIY